MGDDRRRAFVNYFPQHTNQFSVGSTAFDDSRGLLYAQIPAVKGESPTLMVVTSSNLTLQERLQLPENLTGKSVLSSDSNTLYAISESGVTVLPVGSLAQATAGSGAAGGPGVPGKLLQSGSLHPAAHHRRSGRQ